MLWSRGGYKSSHNNALLILQNDPAWRGVFAKDDFAQRVVLLRDLPVEDDYKEAPIDTLPDPQAEVRRNVRGSKRFAGIKEIDDNDLVRVVTWLERSDFRLCVSPSLVSDIIEVVADTRKIHPVRDYLRTVQWDGIKRIGEIPENRAELGTPGWLTTLMGAPDTPYVRKISRWWLISAVARIMQPGCQADHLIILEGKQGKGKSQGVQALSEPWFSQDLGDIRDAKQAQQLLAGVWMIEIGELDAMARATEQALKRFFSQTIDRYREPYGRRVRNHPRQCVFVGTTNNDGSYLRDVTGNRRYWPCHTGHIDVDKIRELRDQIWAEAVVLYRAQERWWPDADDHALITPEQENRRDEHPWTEVVYSILATWRKDHTVDHDDNLITIPAILDKLGIDKGRWDSSARQAVGTIIMGAGWNKKRIMRHGERIYAYMPPSQAEHDRRMEEEAVNEQRQEEAERPYVPGHDFGDES